MPSFVVLGSWTDQGIRNIKDARERAKKAREMFAKAGGKMQMYYTLGKVDFVGVVEVPKEEDAAKVLLCIGSMGNVRTKTMRAWSEAEDRKSTRLNSSHSQISYAVFSL